MNTTKLNKRTIVIASLLKPIDDTRMFEKFGISLSDSENYHVVIIGYPSIVKPDYPNIEFIAIKPFKRISLSRFISPLKVALKVCQVKHDILIVNTHELLIVSLLNRILFGRKIIYDIRENYYRNILHTNTFPISLRSILALFVRAKEKLTAPFFHWFFLAEKGYEHELHFPRNTNTVIENKPRVPTDLVRTNKSKRTRLLFSGTLAESTGIFHAIDLAKNLHELDSEITLHIIGYAAQTNTYQKIKNAIAGYGFISLTGGNQLVPHQEIMKAIFEADFGIISYPSSPHTQNSMPTKLYEYLATGLPILLQNYKPWIEFCRPFEAAIVLDENLTAGQLISFMRSRVFYPEIPSDISWAIEEKKLLSILNKI